MAVNDIYRIRSFCRQSDQLGINVLHYKVTGESGGAVSQLDIAKHWSQLAATVLRPLLASSATFLGCTAQRIRPLPPLVPDADNTGAGAGLGTGEVLPKQTCGIVTWRTPFAGRKYRGRTYLPFPGEDMSDGNGDPTAAYVANLGTYAAAMMGMTVAPGGGAVMTLILTLFHRLGSLDDPITDFTAQEKWATQRRRGDFGKVNPDDPF